MSDVDSSSCFASEPIPVPGFRNRYATADGLIWYVGRDGQFRQLSSVVNKDGYRSVQKCGSDSRVCVHTLVLLAFRGPHEVRTVCRHLDGNKLNNRVDNLCWGTSKENVSDAIKHGVQAIGSRQPQAKLSEADVVEIRRRAKAGGCGVQTRLSREFGVSDTVISHVVTGKAWTHVG